MTARRDEHQWQVVTIGLGHPARDRGCWFESSSASEVTTVFVREGTGHKPGTPYGTGMALLAERRKS